MEFGDYLAKYKDGKIGYIVQRSFPELVNKGLLTKDDLNRLQDKKYSKYTFNVNYPFLKKSDYNNLEEQRLVGNYPRYYAKPICINGEVFLITSEWYKESKGIYLKWLHSKEFDINH